MEGEREFEGQESFLGGESGHKKIHLRAACLSSCFPELSLQANEIAHPFLFCIGCYIASIQAELGCVCKIYLCVCVRKSQSLFSLLTKKVGRSMSEGECSLRSVLSRTSEPSRMSLGQKMNSSSWAARSLASEAAGGNGLSSSKRDGAKWGGADGRTDADGERQ